MGRLVRVWAGVAAGALAAQPCLGVGIDGAHATERRAGAYAGASVRIALGAGAAPAPSARLKLGLAGREIDGRSGVPTRTFEASAFEFGLDRSARPLLFVGGRNAAEIERRLGLAGGGTTLLVVGGLVLAAGAVLLLASDDDEEDENEVCIAIVPKPPGCP